MRLDLALVARGLAPTRARARDAIRRGTVSVDGTVSARPGADVPDAAALALDDPAAGYVSRAALKLIAGLDAFGIDPTGLNALDVGASTGGFTQVLLERGARHVTALDVGHGQLHPSLRDDGAVHVVEGVNARDLTPDHLLMPPELIVADVSFISITIALPPALKLAASGARCVLLVKPQFEAGRDGVGKGGIVAPALAAAMAERLRDWLNERPGWRALGLVPSPIEGGDGNREWLLGGAKEGRDA